GLAIQAEARRERRLEARLTLLALERLEQRGFFAADIGAVAVKGVQLEIEARTQDVLAEETGGTGLPERLFEALVDFKGFAENVVVSLGDAHGIRSHGHAFAHDVRIEAQDIAVFERTGFAFVRVADQVLSTSQRARHEAPLQTRGEPGAATTT